MLTPKLDRELPRGKSPTRPSKMYSSPDKPPKPPEFPKQRITVEQALRGVLKKNNNNTPLTMNDIETAAPKAGVHYHVALSTWANMIQKGESAISIIHCSDKNCLWLKGMAFMSLLKSGVTAVELAKATGLSPEEVRTLAKTYQVFPAEKDREPSLSFHHHRIAACTENPRKWIQKAKEAGWSTREMMSAVKGEHFPGNFPEITVDYVLNLTVRVTELEDEIAELKKQLQASRKVNLSALQLLHSRNKRFYLPADSMRINPKQVQIIN